MKLYIKLRKKLVGSIPYEDFFNCVERYFPKPEFLFTILMIS
jgi:hypothetical protein